MNAARQTPAYLQITEHFRKKILDGDLVEGERLPSHRQISEDWSVSESTALKALSALAAAGLAYSRAGSTGTVVSTKGLYRAGRDWFLTAHRTGAVYTPGVYAEILAAEVIPAPDSVAATLGLEPGSPVIRRHRVTRASNGTPLSTSISYHDAAIAERAPALLETARIIGGPRYVEEALGVAGTRGSDTLSARLATDEEADLLGLETPTAVLVNKCSLRTVDGRFVEYGESVSPPNREVTYEYRIEDATGEE